MKRIDEICGLAVIEARTGERIGSVRGAVLCASTRRLAGLEVNAAGLLRGVRYVPFGHVVMLGDVSVLLDEAGVRAVVKRRKGTAEPRPKERFELGQRVYLTDGSGLGWYTNALVEETDGTVRALEVSTGYLDDLIRGRCWVSEFSLGGGGIISL